MVFPIRVFYVKIPVSLCFLFCLYTIFHFLCTRILIQRNWSWPNRFSTASSDQCKNLNNKLNNQIWKETQNTVVTYYIPHIPSKRNSYNWWNKREGKLNLQIEDTMLSLYRIKKPKYLNIFANETFWGVPMTNSFSPDSTWAFLFSRAFMTLTYC